MCMFLLGHGAQDPVSGAVGAGVAGARRRGGSIVDGLIREWSIGSISALMEQILACSVPTMSARHFDDTPSLEILLRSRTRGEVQ